MKDFKNSPGNDPFPGVVNTTIFCRDISLANNLKYGIRCTCWKKNYRKRFRERIRTTG